VCVLLGSVPLLGPSPLIGTYEFEMLIGAFSKASMTQSGRSEMLDAQRRTAVALVGQVTRRVIESR
jgi:hypothetical protein